MLLLTYKYARTSQSMSTQQAPNTQLHRHAFRFLTV